MVRLTLEQITRESKNGDAGDVTSLHLSHRALSDVSCLSNYQNLERLDLSCNCLSSLESLTSSVNLKWLSVVENKLDSLKGIESFPKLTVLNAGKNKLKTMDDIRSATSLRALILNDNNISSICKLDQLKYLNTLVLSRNPIIDIGDSLMKAKTLTKLSLSHCHIQNIGSSLVSCIELKEIRLSHNKITIIPAELAQNIKLQNLDLGNNLIERWSDIKVLSSLQNLKNLNLQGNPIAEKDNLAKKVKKLIPSLRIFNAKPIERSSAGRNKSGEDGPYGKKDDAFFKDTSQVDATKEAKREKSKLDPKISSREKLQNRTKEDRDRNAEKEFKRKKGMGKEEGKSEGMDDGETPFLDLISLERNRHESDPKKKLDRKVSGAELLEGLVIDHVKKKKKGQHVAVGPAALQLLSPVQDVGMGGPSAWDD
ncbi:uncharacterized protein [Typha latifolia]|uniref:uncharacterized protein n=1 Tax=Typha latifolia TaxID=4733 RepID=UPI003C2E0C9D